jgi:ferredoxin
MELMQSSNGETHLEPAVKSGCVGCGVCEMICPVEGSAIIVGIDNNADTLRRGRHRTPSAEDLTEDGEAARRAALRPAVDERSG